MLLLLSVFLSVLAGVIVFLSVPTVMYGVVQICLSMFATVCVWWFLASLCEVLS